MNEHEKPAEVPYIVFEAEQARAERRISRFILTIIICILLIFASNLAWLYAWMQYDYSGSESTESVMVDGKDGIANYIGNDGDITNGEDSSSQDDQAEHKAP